MFLVVLGGLGGFFGVGGWGGGVVILSILR